MDRIVGIDHVASSARDAYGRSERLRHRRAAEERCVRSGLLRRCAPAPPGGACRGA